jgi:hypothetical protein
VLFRMKTPNVQPAFAKGYGVAGPPARRASAFA